jgi:hypothetical protein
MNTLREKFAKIAHESWTGWMEYLFSKSIENPDGSYTIPKEFVDWWKSEMDTPYENLTEKQKESDRKEADKYLSTFNIDNKRFPILESRASGEFVFTHNYDE